MPFSLIIYYCVYAHDLTNYFSKLVNVVYTDIYSRNACSQNAALSWLRSNKMRSFTALSFAIEITVCYDIIKILNLFDICLAKYKDVDRGGKKRDNENVE